MSRIRDFTKGFGFLIQGFTFLMRHPSLWISAIIPTVINLALLGLMITGFIHYYGDIYAWLSAHLGHLKIADPATWYWQAVNALLWFVDILFQALIVLTSMVVLLIISYALSFIVAAPFNDALSERVEVLVTGREPPPFSLKKFIRDILRTIKIESIKAIILISIPIVLFLFNFVPLIGGWIYIILTFVFGAWDIGYSYADLPLGRRVAPLRERFSFAMQHKWSLMGLGVGFAVPFFSLIFSAPLVVGGTLFYIDLTKLGNDSTT